jgi:methyl-accepting chemotaxis protein
MFDGVIAFLRRSPLAVRIAAAPLVVLVAAMLLLVLSGMQARQATTAIDQIHLAAAEQRGQVDQLIAQAYHVHSDVSRHLALVDSGTSEAKLADIRKSIETNLAKAAALTAALKGHTGAGDVMADVEARLGKYAKAVANMNDMAQSDRLIAIPLMTHVDKQFGELSDKARTAQGLIVETAARAAQATRDEAEAASRRFWLASLGLLLAVGSLTILIVRSITTPLARLVPAMSALSAGKHDTVVDGTAAHDEVGDMARALAVFKDNALEADRLRASQLTQQEQAEHEKRHALQAMAETVERETNASVEQISQQTGTMAANAVGMTESARAVSANSQNVAAAAAQALANAETVAAASEQLSASIQEIGQQIANSSRVTAIAVGASARARSTIEQLARAASHIGEVAGLINDIASQTNLLALNATIEAARAGDAGKGFAVVANEVKSLANQTARATEEISQQISAIQNTTAQVVSAVGEITAAIEDVDAMSSAIATAVEEQGAATGEIARNVAQTSDAAREVSARISEVSSEADVTGQRADEVNRASTDVAKSIDELRTVLVRVVRTATKEVDRRNAPRHPLGRAGTLIVNGERHPLTIENLSRDGFLGSCAESVPPAGHRVHLEIQGHGAPLPAIVRDAGNDQIHARFDLSGAEAAAWDKQVTTLLAQA